MDRVALATQLVGMHIGAALILAKPLGEQVAAKFILKQDEALKLADALIEVSKHYNISLDPKTMAWLGLGFTCLSIYGPKAFEAAQAARQSKTAQPPRVPLRPQPPPAPQQKPTASARPPVTPSATGMTNGSAGADVNGGGLTMGQLGVSEYDQE